MDRRKDTLNRNYNIDLIKIISCIAVVGLHTLNVDNKFTCALYYLCGFAVPFFFIINGYFTLKKNRLSVIYFLNKIGNIFRIVILWNVFFWGFRGVVYLFSDKLQIGYVYKLPQEIVGCFLQKGALWQFWYLGALIITYLCLLILNRFFLCKEKEQRVYMCGKLWIIVMIISIIIQGISYYMGYSVQSNIIQTFRMWTWLQYFLLGSFIDKIEKEICNRISLMNHGIIVLFLTGVTVYFKIYMGIHILDTNFAEYFYDDLLNVVWIVFLFVFILRLSIKEIWKKRIQHLSFLTFGVYIIHPFIITLFRRGINVSTGLTSFVLFMVISFISFIIIGIFSKMLFSDYFIKI